MPHSVPVGDPSAGDRPANDHPASERRVALVTLGCARNEVDSEELAGRLAGAGWRLVGEDDDADVVVVNTCGFIESAKKDSIDTLLAASDIGGKVVAVGCLAERYGDQLAGSLPEADAVLGFDDYAEIGARLDDVLAGRPLVPHRPRDRRTLLPISPVARVEAAVAVPGHGAGRPGGTGIADLPAGVAPPSGPRVLRRRLDDSPVAPLKLASGCDRRCAFCAIPSFRGAFVSRRPEEVLAEARWLAGHGVRELVLVSENSTSYGKDLGDLRLLERLLPELAGVAGIDRIRLSYLQPAELRPGLVQVLAGTEKVAPYFDLSFQHASEPVLRRMRRFGSTERFLGLVERIRGLRPDAGIRSNVIVGFPGETAADLAELERFLTEARLDAVGVFGYSDEEGTEAATYDGKVRSSTVARRVDRVTRLVEELTAQRAEERVGEIVEVLVESVDTGLTGPAGPTGVVAEGRAAHQAPEVDGSTVVHGLTQLTVGTIVRARVTGSAGVDLVAELCP
ncbi:MAG TPA: 30S ribosomal protein S12 methylthiotransferase RimO [Mycobacteriales bacterium]|nr:30S ribosomal protein S12 methylthiotransferase RimO [Mycobacteriales bacterium]